MASCGGVLLWRGCPESASPAIVVSDRHAGRFLRAAQSASLSARAKSLPPYLLSPFLPATSISGNTPPSPKPPRPSHSAASEYRHLPGRQRHLMAQQWPSAAGQIVKLISDLLPCLGQCVGRHPLSIRSPPAATRTGPAMPDEHRLCVRRLPPHGIVGDVRAGHREPGLPALFLIPDRVGAAPSGPSNWTNGSSPRRTNGVSFHSERPIANPPPAAAC